MVLESAGRGRTRPPLARVSKRFTSVKGLTPFPHRGDNPFSTVMTRGSRGSELPPRRGASGRQLEQTPKQEPSRGRLSSTGRTSGQGWAQGPAQQPSPGTRPAWEGQSRPSVIQQTSLGDLAPRLP